MSFRSAPPHRHMSGRQRRVWVPDNKYAKPTQGKREMERRRRQECELIYKRALTVVVHAGLAKALEEGIYL